METGIRTPASFEIALEGGARAAAIRVDRPEALAEAAAAIGLARVPLALVLVGGAAGMSDAETQTLQRLLAAVVAPFVEDARGLVIDGGTDAGVMRAAGRARAESAARFPLVGVVVGELAATAALEPNHTHIVLVPGSRWGDESAWLPRLATVLADRAVTVLAGGGTVARADLEESRRAGLPVLAVAGTGGLAEALAVDGTVESAPLEDPAAVAAALRRLTR